VTPVPVGRALLVASPKETIIGDDRMMSVDCSYSDARLVPKKQCRPLGYDTRNANER
jgi:hypothetical protein